MKLVFVVGARPNFIKAAPVLKNFRRLTDHECLVIHTGQHFDDSMSKIFLKQLGIGNPDVNLGVGTGTHAVQTAKIMVKIEEELQRIQPDWVFVFGDVNSTVGTTLVAKKLHIKVAHVESGLRSHDMNMPEEINRILTDHISDLLFVTEKSGLENLQKEGISEDRTYFVGNTMIDSLTELLPEINQNTILSELNLIDKEYVLLTLHRPSNVDDPVKLGFILDKISRWSAGKQILWPVHPRIDRENLQLTGANWRLSAPVGYFQFISLMKNAAAVFTDSGGIQEETTFLGIPCYTIRNNTERPVTCTAGSNTLVTGTMLGGDWQPPLKVNRLQPQIELWDGRAATRLVECFEQHINANRMLE
ncbi:MAG: UDP-N-acetylglucosamine 2-epimerase (non-hydrolyzing) [FCB group bacterium]|nr:UDP-N-acetylglucosamine 2-epimerase (non-hydrolyzing) [FCB group bacterium]